jgi:hypothetical protein
MQFEFYYSSISLGVNLIKIHSENNTSSNNNYRNSEVHYYNPNNINTSLFIKFKNPENKKSLVQSNFNYKNIDYIADITFKKQMEEQNSNIAYTYESKYSNLLYFDLKLQNLINVVSLQDYIEKEKDRNFKFKIQIILSIDLKKVLHNFESYENEMEFGFKIPCGLILLNKDKASSRLSNNFDSIFNLKNMKIISTNQIYFNIPMLDNTVPFTIIAFTWVVFGFILIQMLNKYLNSEGGLITNSIFAIKDRLVDRCYKLKIVIDLLCCKSKKVDKAVKSDQLDKNAINKIEENYFQANNEVDQVNEIDKKNN